MGFNGAILSSDQRIVVTHSRGFLIFAPRIDLQSTALIFYPGAFVDPTAYAPLARTVAEHGYRTVIVELPCSDPFLECDTVTAITKSVIVGDTKTKRWFIAGHSRGGFFAARFTRDHPELVDGLILIGTSQPRKFDLSGLGLGVTKIYGTNDGLVNLQEIKDYAKYLPPYTHWVRIEGGNHSQFGYHGFQRGDRRARISREHQQKILASAVIEALQR
jgi:predicted esterase